MKVTFFPPLQETRRAWILSKLRQEHVDSVLDIGCGEGSLLVCLCNPPAFLEQHPNSINNKNTSTTTLTTSAENPTQHTSSPSHPNTFDGLPDLHISKLSGLDISRSTLESCMFATSPPTEYRYLPRWEPLEAKIWLGSLDVYNPEFIDVECIVATEVIEHLPQPVLSGFAPTLLGTYRPRLLLLTTPNYTFNARFSAPGIVDPYGFPDPTKRTKRVFRHADHRFEWTPEEFKDWCKDAASAWGYTVEVNAIGLPSQPDPWGRDKELGSATQVAVFRRVDSWEGQRPISSVQAEERHHELLKTHIHEPHPQAGKAESHDTIRELVSNHMLSYYFDDGYSIWDLWVEKNISVACGGRLDVLLGAIDASPEFCIVRTVNLPSREWNVRFAGAKHQEAVDATRKEYGWKTNSPQSPWNHEGNVKGSEEECVEQSSAWMQRPFEWTGNGGVWSVENTEATWGSTDVWDTGAVTESWC